MFRPPDPDPYPRTTIFDLPHELLLHIGAQFTHLKRNRDLASLSLVCKKWRIIAQEWLLKEPRFNLTYIDKYLWELGHHEHLHAQIRSLEIWSYSEDRILYDDRGRMTREYKRLAARICDPQFLEKCKEIISYWAMGHNVAPHWKQALYFDCIPALFGVLICILPNLKELKLGNAWLMDFPIFSNMLSPDANTTYMQPTEWKHTFTNSAMSLLLTRLEVLDLPADMSCMLFVHINTVFDFRRFENLKEIGISMRPLWWWPGLRGNRFLDPRELFPPSLEVLKVSEATWATSVFLQNLSLAKTGGHFPALRRMEVYHMKPLELVWKECKERLIPVVHPVYHMKQLCQSAEVALYIYFPPWSLKTWEIQGTPWRLREERDVFTPALQCGYRKDMGFFGIAEDIFDAFEAEWDKDGDAVMDI
jgi:hypothetical protein